MPADLLRALRPLQIPSNPDLEREVSDAVSRTLSQARVDEKDQEIYLAGLIDEWQADLAVPSQELRKYIRAGIKAGVPGPSGELLSASYSRLY
jgi:hypothetical protein